MTVSTTANRIAHAGDGSTVAFSYPYYFQSANDLVVVLVSSAGVETTKTLTTHYSVSGTAVNNVYPNGGTVTMTTAPASGETLVIYRDAALTQSTDYVSADPFPAETHEQGLDRLTMISQRTRELANRSFRLTDGYTATFDPTIRPTASRLLAFDSGATGIEGVVGSDASSNSVTVITYQRLLSQLLASHAIQVQDFGAITTDVDCTSVVNSAIDYINNSSQDSIELHFAHGPIYRALTGFDEIARSGVHIDGHGAQFKLTSNPLFTFGDRSSTFTDGSLRNVKVTGVSADATSRIVKGQGFNEVVVSNVNPSIVAGLAVLGHAGTAATTHGCSGWRIETARGEILDIDDAVGVHGVYGNGSGGPRVDDVHLTFVESGGSVPTIPTDRVTAHAQALTYGIKFEDSWDTPIITNSNFAHCRYGLHAAPATGKIISNGVVANTYLDMCGLKAIHVDTGSGGTFNNWTFNGNWYASLDDHAIHFTGSGGQQHNNQIVGGRIRHSGKANFKGDSTQAKNNALIGVIGRDANRLSANTGSDQDGFVISGAGWTIEGGASGQAHVSVSGWQARYGYDLSPNLSNVAILNVTGDGATGGVLINANTSAQTNAKVSGNRKVGANQPDYVSPATMAAPTSGAQQTWMQAYDAEITIGGGTVSQIDINSINVGVTSGTWRLSMGDTYTITYSSAPTVTVRELA